MPLIQEIGKITEKAAPVIANDLKANASKVPSLFGGLKAYTKGLFQSGGAETAKVADTISTSKLAVPNLIKKAGVGTAAVLIGAYGVGFAGNKIGGAMEDVGLKTKSSADMIRDNVDANKSAIAQMSDLGMPPERIAATLYGQVPFNQYGNSYTPNMAATGTRTGEENILTASFKGVGIIAIAIGVGLLGFYGYKKVARIK